MSTALLITLALATLVVIGLVVTYNRLVALRNEAGAALANVDAQLNRRADLVPNLVEVVRAYAGHEEATLDAVTRARAATVVAGTPAELAAADLLMGNAIGQVMGLAEAYPELQASSSFGELQRELGETEDKLAVARGMYNHVVQRYNTASQQVPALWLASAAGFRPLEYVSIEQAGERDATVVDLGPSRGGSG